MRHALTFLLLVLLLIVVGLALGYLALDFSSSRSQLSSTGSLAYYDCSDEECVWVEDQWEEWWQPQAPDDGSDERWIVENDAVDVGGNDNSEEVEVVEWWTEDIGDEGTVDEEYIQVGWETPNSYVDEVEYIEDEYWGPEKEETVTDERYEVRDPWYVRSFPGFGQVAERMIPGLQVVSPTFRATPQPITQPSRIYPQPSCWISAYPTNVSYDGRSVLQWVSYNATRASLTDFGLVPTSGSRVAHSLLAERIYTLGVSGQGGSGSCYTRISVLSSHARPTCIISAYPSAIRQGESASLAWSSQNASSAQLSGVGVVSTRGGMYVAPQQSIAYTLSVYNLQGNSNTCTANVTVHL